MQDTAKKLNEIILANAVAANDLAKAGFSAMERLSALNIHATMLELDSAGEAVKAVLSAKSPQEVGETLVDFATPMAERGVSHARSLFEAVGEMREEFSAILGKMAERGERDMESMSKDITSAAPAQVAKAMEDTMSVARSISSAAKAATATATKKATELAEQGLVAATGTVVKATRAATAKPQTKKR